MIAKHKKYSRGYEFRNFDGQPQDKVIGMDIPEKVIIPLRQGFGNEVIPVVEPGQKVAAGQIIGRDDKSVSSPVHSSVNGKVVRVEGIDYLGRETNAVIIESDGTSSWQKLKGYSPDWEKLSGEKIEELIYLSGVSSFNKTGIPTRFKSSVISPEDVKNVIIHGVESEVHNLPLTVLLEGEKLSHFAEGLRILKKVMANARFHLALDKSQEQLVGQVAEVVGSWVDVTGLEPKYPLDRDEVLVSTLLGQEFPYGYSAANIGVIVLDIQAVLQVYEAVAEGKPLIERTIALCGPGFRENLCIKVRIGTPIEQIISGKIVKDKDLRYVRNSCLTGSTISDLSLPIDRTFNTIVALLEGNEGEFLFFVRPGLTKDSYSRTFLSTLFVEDSKIAKKKCETNIHGEKRPCLFCDFCVEVCPTGVIPHLLARYVERGIVDETLLNYKVFNCIECNLCSYVCPSKIPVAKYIKEGQQKLVDEGYGIPQPGCALKGVKEYKSIK